MIPFFNHQSKTITNAALILSAATLLSRLVGIIRDRVLAHQFGVGPTLDAYYAAFKVPDLIYNLLVVGALTAGFIPTFTKLFNQDEKHGAAWALANNIINIIGVALIVLCGLGIIFSAPLSQIIAPGFSDTNLELVTRLSQIMYLSPLLLGLSMIAGGILQSLRRFTLYAIAPVFYNFGIIVGAAGFAPIIGDTGLAWGVVIGAGMHGAIQIYGAWQAGWRWHWRFTITDPETKLVGKLMVPRTLGLALTQINQVVVTILASLLPVGSLAVYSFADNLQAVPTGIIGIPFALAAFPVLAAAASDGKTEEFISRLSTTIRQIVFLTAPLTILFLLLRAQIVRTVLGSGRFDWTATINTADALAFFSLGLLAQSLIPLLARAFYSLSDSKTPFIIGIFASLTSIIAALVFMRLLGAPGLALAASIGAIVNAVLLAFYLRSRLGSLDEKNILPLVGRVTVASLIMAVGVQMIKYPLAKILDQSYFWGIFGQGLLAGLFGIAIYIILCYILRVPEVLQLKDAITSKAFKYRQLPTKEGLDLRE